MRWELSTRRVWCGPGSATPPSMQEMDTAGEIVGDFS